MFLTICHCSRYLYSSNSISSKLCKFLYYKTRRISSASTTMFKPVTHVILDLDGVILDTETTYEKVVSVIGERYGKKYTDDIKLKVRGTPEPMTAKIIVTEMGLPLSPEEFIQIYKPMCEGELKHPPLVPGIKKLVLHLHKHNIPMAVATSAAEGITKIKSKNYPEVFSCFRHVIHGSTDPEVKHGKPYPDIFLICASRFPDKPAPEKCLVLEDAPNGVLAGKRAGMQVVMLPGGDVTPELTKDATLVLKTFEDFKPEAFGLPAYEN